ncbi:MAG TPA: efflux RND transporter periplasmic adaptor subunit [Longimicrobiales bacterium]|nr:efflux RND transporter periplasmic adaptor subunit [Longimicrobiales bacterium]
MKTSTRWILGGVAVVAVAAAWTMFQSGGTRVEVAEARLDTLSVTVEDEGRTRARELFTVAAPVAGRLSRPAVEAGDVVDRDMVLATLSPAPEDPRVQAALEAQVSAAQARVVLAQAEAVEAERQVGQARREAERRQPLYEMGALTRETMERFEEAAEQAVARQEAVQAALEAARADLAQARARLLGTSIDGEPAGAVPVRAPVSGTILRVLEESERVVQAGTPLFEIADPGSLQVVVDVLTEDAVRVAPGSRMWITGWGGDTALEGTVLYVEPSAFTKVSTLGVEEQRVNVVGAVDDPPPELGVGYRIDVAVVVWQGRDVLTVPASALFQQEGRWHLFTVDGGRARLRAVEVGRQGPGRTEVTAGLEPGTQVILYPAEGVSDGARVRTATR